MAPPNNHQLSIILVKKMCQPQDPRVLGATGGALDCIGGQTNQLSVA